MPPEDSGCDWEGIVFAVLEETVEKDEKRIDIERKTTIRL